LPVLINNEVNNEFGTAINSISPAHDFNSLQVAFHYNLNKEGYIDEFGKFTTPLFEGLSVFDPETNKYVLKLLEE
jgi:valyl-tRNA synthetase